MIQIEKLPFKEEIDVLEKGGVCIFPTDTAFALGCRIDRKAAIERVFNIKKRDIHKAVPILVDSIEMAERYVEHIDDEVKEKLLNVYWPGALTVIMKANLQTVSPLLTGGGDTVALRMPKHQIALHLIKGSGVPIIGTSANFSGTSTPYTADQVSSPLIMKVDFFIPGVCYLSKESTVIDLTQKPWRIVRQGAINLTNIS